MNQDTPSIRDAAHDARTMAQIETAIRNGNVELAEELARGALASGLVTPKLLHLRSFWLARRNRNDEALADLRAAAEMAPDDVLIRNAYGILLSKMEDWPASIVELRAAVALKPDFAPAHMALGWSLEGVGELDDARAGYETAIALQPDFVEAMVRLAALAYRRADWNLAREMSARALKLNPDQYAAMATEAAAAMMQGDLEHAEKLIRRLVGRKPGSPLNGAMVKRTLGDLRHAQGRYDQAFTAYSASNKEKYDLYAPRFERERNLSFYCEWLAAHLENAPRSGQVARDDARSGAREHIFLIGFPRSGTTLLENVLASHPDVCTLSERDALSDLASIYLEDDAALGRLAAISAEEIEAGRAQYWTRVREFGEDVAGRIFIDKMPLATMNLPLIATLFPKAKILFALRDPRDVVLSCFRRNFAINPAMFEMLSLERAARFYAAIMRIALAAREKFDLHWHDIRNESLIADFEGEARKVCAFIGIEWDERMRDFAEHARARTIRTPSSIQVVRGINSDSVGQWRHYAAHMCTLMPVLAPWVERFGYPPEETAP